MSFGIYEDVFSGDEICSSAFAPTEEPDYPIVLRIRTELEEDEDGDEYSAKVISLVQRYQLNELPLTKKTFMAVFKKQLKAITDRLTSTAPDRVAEFKSQSAAYLKNVVLPDFDEYSFYAGRSNDPDGLVLMARYFGEDYSPTFFFFKDGCNFEKC
eukprot:TRINITY_DN302_c0_g1_i1.p1 TRINITY_DN302_c0_g1~~TRINITY_DN302_c0_g1_i1.p1  ORF type:complete len:156 (-),score=52.23 TRINITY_DN302_c0_g1_i1:45-512(-)